MSETRALRRTRPTLQPGWQLTALFVGYPVWWLLGVAEFAGLAAAGVMALELLRRRRIEVPRGFGWWLLFLAWVIAGVVLLQVTAPGTVTGVQNTRYVTWAFRVAWYLAATIVLLYVGNMRKELSALRITRALGWMFITVVAGGLLGTFLPHLDFPSVIEIILPQRITKVPFVHDLVHPIVAQLNVINGEQNPRASAPFSYTNDWGLNFACLLPFFLVSWCGPDAGWRRPLAPVVLVLATVPVILSLNRGLWIALIVTALFVAIRSALSGRVRMLGAVLGGALVVGLLVSVTPFGAVIQDRLDNGYSDDSRANLGTQSVTTVAEKSPVVGFGTTRDLQGSFISIAGGATEECPLCSPPALGTQGHLWLVVFSQGIGGLFLYLGFFAIQFRRHVRLRSGYVTLGLTVIVAHIVTMPVYDTIGPAMFAIMAAVGLLWRESIAERDRYATEPTLRGYLGVVRHGSPLVVGGVLFGLCLGAVWQYERGDPAVATASIVIPNEPVYPSSVSRATTLDTVAQMASDAEALDAIDTAIGRAGSTEKHKLEVTATPNTRILHIIYSSGSAAHSRRAVTIAAETLIDRRYRDLQDRRAKNLRKLGAHVGALATAIRTVDTAGARTPAGRSLLEPVNYELVTESTKVGTEMAEVTYAPIDPGRIIGPTRVHHLRDGWIVALTSGLMLGLLVGVVLCRWRETVSARLTRRTNVLKATGLKVLADVSGAAVGSITAGSADGFDDTELTRVLQPLQPSACLSLSSDETTCTLAARLDGRIETRTSPRRSGPVVLVASRRSRVRSVLRLRESLELAGNDVAGIILVSR